MDGFGDPIRTATGEGSVLPLSVAQQAARASRERACRSLLRGGGALREEQLFAAGAVRLLCDTVALARLAGDDLERVTCTRHILRRVRATVRGSAALGPADAEERAAEDLYNWLCLDLRGAARPPAPPAASVALWGRSLAFAAECYFADSPRHYSAVLAMALQKLSGALSATDAPLSENERLRAEEALGRVLLLQARQTLYTSGAGWQAQVDRAGTVLRRAASRPAGASAGARTAPYDAARASALAGDADACREWLRAAMRAKSLPPLRVLRVEPDFAIVRDAAWFKEVASGDHAQQAHDVQQGHAHGQSQGQDASYSVLRSGLITSGFAVEPILEHLRFPLYMDRPRGALMEVMVRQAEAEAARESKALAARERLHARLRKNGLRIKREIAGDGNCQFSAVSDQMYDSTSHAAKLRADAVAWLRSHGDWDTGNGACLRWFVDSEWDTYCNRMASSGAWGDHLTLIALSETLGRPITVISSVEGDSFLTEIKPSGGTTARVLLLSHYAEFHYGSVTYI